jgi:predicted RNA binding protein YcfA (HicA-like mRNA interferase family)
VSYWPSTRARKVFDALLRTGWSVKARKSSSHIQLTHPTRGDFTWAFRDSEEIGPKMLSRIAKHTDLKPEDL